MATHTHENTSLSTQGPGRHCSVSLQTKLQSLPQVNYDEWLNLLNAEPVQAQLSTHVPTKGSTSKAGHPLTIGKGAETNASANKQLFEQ